MRRTLLLLWLLRPAGACSCAGPSAVCEKLPDRGDVNTAFFLGSVQQVDGAAGQPYQFRRVRFLVTENFTGADQPTFDVWTASQTTACGIDFITGEAYLVEAHRRNKEGYWETGLCSRTKPVERAQDDLRVLQAWKSGRTLPARITGEVWDPVNRRDPAGVRINLLGGKQRLSTVSDDRGQFAFENLDTVSYEVEAVLPTGAVRRKVDLTHAWCAGAFFTTTSASISPRPAR